MRKGLLLVLLLLGCAPVLVERQYGLEENVTSEEGKIIKIDTVHYGEGYLKRVMFQKR